MPVLTKSDQPIGVWPNSITQISTEAMQSLRPCSNASTKRMMC